MSATSPPALAGVLSPSTTTIPRRLADPLRSYCGRAFADSLRRCLREAGTALSAPTTTIAFGGHFSSGKSTLINGLLGRPLLPASDYPETGVECWIEAGNRDAARVVTGLGTLAVPCSPDGIAPFVSLIDDRGDGRAEVRQVERVELTVACPPPALAPGVRWIDSPGINDSDEMDERAAAVAARADVLVWVVNSRQPLSETEQRLLAAHIERKGRHSVAFVVNAFLPGDTPAAWAAFLAERLDYHRGRVQAFLAAALPEWGDNELVVPFAVVSARAIGDTAGGLGDDFGAAEVHELLSTIGDPAGTTLRAARLDAAVAALRPLSALLADQRQRCAQAQTEAEAARRQLAAEASAQRAKFDKAVQRATAKAIAAVAEGAEAAAEAAVAALGKQLHRDDRYGKAITAQLSSAAEDAATNLVRKVQARAAEQSQVVGPDLDAIVHNALRPPAVTVAIPNHPVAKTKRGWGAIVGGVLGTLVAPGPGTAIGAAVGAGLSGSASGGDNVTAAVARDRSGAQLNARTAAQAAADAVGERKAELVRAILAVCTPVAIRPDTGPAQFAATLDELESRLQRLVFEPLRQAGAALPAPDPQPVTAAGSPQQEPEGREVRATPPPQDAPAPKAPAAARPWAAPEGPPSSAPAPRSAPRSRPAAAKKPWNLP